MRISERKKKLLVPSWLLGLSRRAPVFLACAALLSGCALLPPKIPLSSKSLRYKIQWSYFSPLQAQSLSFSSVVFIQGPRWLRLDILQPLIGSAGGLILSDEEMTLLAPLKRLYYKGKFSSKAFFPDFPAFPGSWLIAFLRARPPEGWRCAKQEGLRAHCSTDHFEIKWEYKSGRLKKILLKDLKGRRIKARIKSLSSYEFPPRLFEPSLKGWQRRESPVFFKNL